MKNKIKIIACILAGMSTYIYSEPIELSYFEMSQIEGGESTNSCGDSSESCPWAGRPTKEFCKNGLALCRDNSTAYFCKKSKTNADCNDQCKENSFTCGLIKADFHWNGFWCTQDTSDMSIPGECVSYNGKATPKKTCK